MSWFMAYRREDRIGGFSSFLTGNCVTSVHPVLKVMGWNKSRPSETHILLFYAELPDDVAMEAADFDVAVSDAV